MPVRVFAAAAALLGADPQFRSDVNNVEEFIAGMIFGLIQRMIFQTFKHASLMLILSRNKLKKLLPISQKVI